MVVPYYDDGRVALHVGHVLDVLAGLEPGSVQTCITSPPYWGLRAYGTDPQVWGDWRGELGSEPTPAQYVANIVAVFRAVRRVLRDDGCIWINLGDSYSGSGKGPTGHNGIGDQGQRQGFVDQRSDVPGLKAKDLVGIPWRVAFALQADGWYLRSDIIWSKPNPMPESVTDRPTKAHEYLFLLSKRADYYYDAEAIKEPQTDGSLARWGNGGERIAIGPKGVDPLGNNGKASGSTGLLAAGRNRRSVWSIPTEAYPAAHFATFPRKLVEPCILAGTSARGQCPACGAPWRRMTSTEYDNPGNRTTNGQKYIGRGHETPDYAVRLEKRTETLGWAPSCACDAGDPVPQVVLDPFAGSGTTLAVARWHQRRAVGIELSAEYARLIEQRLAQGVLL